MKSLVLFIALIAAQVAHADVCFNSNFVNGWTYDSKTEILTVTEHKTAYEVTTTACGDLARGLRISFKSFFSTMVCRGDSIVVMDGWGQPTQECFIDKITKK